MKDETKLGIIIMTGIVIILISLLMCVTIYNMHKNAMKAKVVVSGNVDPGSATFLFESTGYTEQIAVWQLGEVAKRTCEP